MEAAVSFSIDGEAPSAGSLRVFHPAAAADRQGVGRITDLAELCSWLVASDRAANGCEPEFPLYRRATLRSNISLAQQGSEISPCYLSARAGEGNVPTLFFNILTLAGPGGPLPLQLSDTMMAGRKSGGGSLHVFLDLINRRFWELLLQSYRTGARPQHGFNNHASRALIFRLTEACAGFDPLDDGVAQPSSSLDRAYLLSYCFNAGSGFGGQQGIEELLRRMLGRPLSIKEVSARHAPVVMSCRATLGGSAGRQLLGRNAILGSRALVRQQMLMTVYDVEAGELEQFVPGDDGRGLRATLDSLNLAMRGRVEPFTLRSMVAYRNSGGGTGLGKTCRRLGWGGLLGRGGPQTTIVTVSARAIFSNNGAN